MKGTVDVFIPDEAHFAKNPEAKRTKMVYGKGGFSWMAGATWPLSGTPAPKHAAELWCMLRAFGVVGMSYGDFIRRYCTVDWMSGKPNGTKVEMIPELKALLATVMLRRTRKQVAPEMPDIGFDFLEVKIGADLNACRLAPATTKCSSIWHRTRAPQGRSHRRRDGEGEGARRRDRVRHREWFAQANRCLRLAH
jgi:hypothetical protein